jgi:hypothetical protein
MNQRKREKVYTKKKKIQSLRMDAVKSRPESVCRDLMLTRKEGIKLKSQR